MKELITCHVVMLKLPRIFLCQPRVATICETSRVNANQPARRSTLWGMCSNKYVKCPITLSGIPFYFQLIFQCVKNHTSRLAPQMARLYHDFWAREANQRMQQPYYFIEHPATVSGFPCDFPKFLHVFSKRHTNLH